MGTLTSQEPRDYKEISLKALEHEIEEVLSLAKKHKIEAASVIEIKRVMEMRRKNDLYVFNGDVHDEQMKGIGELLESTNDSLVFIGQILDK